MYKTLLTALITFFILSAYAQNRAIVKGTVLDSVTRQPLELATVAVLDAKDTTAALILYMVSDKKGAFLMHNLPTGTPVKILISFVSYRPFRKTITLKKGETLDLGGIMMSPKLLNEVSITGERPPIMVKKDTIEFAAEAFKTRPNAVVEELLKKLPGIEVDNYGNIVFQGKKVNKVLVDGREFFASDIRIATKNLDAELIDKVQVYDDRENDPNHLIEDARVEKIINLKFKKKLRKSTFGKVYAGGGTEGRYESGGLFNIFRDTLQISLLGLSNNLSNTGFDFNDLYTSGGLNRGGDAISRGGGGMGFGRAGISGIQKTTSGGVNINTDYGKKFKLNIAYYHSHDNNDYNGKNTRDQLTQDTDFTTSTTTNRFRIDDKHNLSITVKAQPNTATQISYTPFFTYYSNQTGSKATTNSYSNFFPQVNQSVSSSNGSGNNMQFQQSFNYNHQLKTEGASITIDHNFSVNPDRSNNYDKSALTSYLSSFPSYSLDRYSNNLNNNISANLAVSYRYPLTKKLTADVNVGTDYNKGINRVSTYDFNPATGLYDLFLLNTSSDLTRNLWKEHVSPGITYALRQHMSLVMGVAAQWQQINNQFNRNIADLDQNYFDLLPNARFSFGTYTKGNYSVSYTRTVGQVNIGDLIPYSVIFSPLFTVTGNPNLNRSHNNNFGISFNTYRQQSQTSYSINGNLSIEEDGVYRRRTLDAAGAETSTPINQNGRYSSNIYAFISKRFKKSNDWQLSLSTNVGLNQSHNFFEINHQDGYQNNYGVNFSQHLSLNGKDIITLDPSYGLNQSISSYTGVQYNNIHTTTFNFDTPYTIYWPKRTNISGTYTYTYNPLVPAGYQKSSNLLNVSIAREFLKKDRAEIKLACYDILNQAINSTRFVNENIINDTQSQIINRYFLLTLRWKFNTAKADEKKQTKTPGMLFIN
ncbi:outer membrane receptor protein involved in Fe transport [Mucilaginibacter gracilis]|uniref:Outer membrane receptor protein involved in Fe transport n=1 Tax=Mucilaginibacter gracilis TaxID=423350 RepID=A0A495J0P1_9SPHI|nr:TonB-dependent receptor [Mucilaginibacter gracilis]RKR82545.1 outer membrane receptor protein involved in Fe transport [Mucilaginibacter gracilis]